MSRTTIPSMLFAVLLLASCRDPILEPEIEPAPRVPERVSLTAAHTLVPGYSCSRSWANGSDGDWYDAGNWSPAGTPTLSDTVCIDAPGSYTVTADFDVLTTLVQVGGAGSSPTLRLEHSLLVEEGIVVEVGARIEIDASQTVHLGSSPPTPGAVLSDADWFENRGVVQVVDGCGCAPVSQWYFRSILNDGWMNLEGASRFGILGDLSNNQGRDFENRGVLLTSGADTIDVLSPYVGGYSAPRGGAFRQTGGTIGGSAPVRIEAFDDFMWEAGTLPVNVADPDRPLVVLDDVQSLVLGHDGLSGHLELRNVYGVEGGFGPDVRLRFVFDPDHANFVSLLTTDRELNTASRLEFARAPGSARNTFLVASTDRAGASVPWVNRGDIEVVDESLVSFVALFGSLNFTNEGSIAIASGSDLHVGIGPTSRRRSFLNRGSIVAESGASFEMDHGTFTAAAAGSMTGRLVLEGAELAGGGRVGDVISAGGTISPGVAAPGFFGVQPRFGRLTMESLFLDTPSRLVVEVGGPQATKFDRVIVRGQVHYGGELRIVTVAPFPGGKCGQVIPVMTDASHSGKTPAPRGAFDSLVGTNPASGRSWRLHNPDGLLALAGYRPGPELLYADPTSVSVVEGGVARRYTACFGSAVPTSPVTVTPTSVQGDVAPAPAFSVTPIDHALPRALFVSAIDDPFVEGPHADVLEHRLASKDPTFNASSVAPLDITITDNDGEADLSILKVAQEDNKFLGDSMDTVFRVTNGGPTESSGSTVVSTALTGLRFVSAVGALCSDDGTGIVTCQVGAIAAGGQADFTITFEGIVVGLHSSSWTVTGQEPDPNGGNDEVTYTQRVN